MSNIYNVYDLKPFERAVNRVDKKFIILSASTVICFFVLRSKIAKQNEKIDKLEKEFEERVGTEGE